MPPTAATERYSVRSYEIDGRGELRPSALCNYLQESAGLHAQALGVGIPQLLEQGMTWFLWRLHLRLGHPLPGWGEAVAVDTWPAQMGRPYAIRDFRIGDAAGCPLGVATSAWLLMDTVKNRLVRRPPESLRALHPEPPVRALDDAFRSLPPCPGTAPARTLKVRRGDLDMNRHLNHVAAIEAVFEAAPAEVVDQRRLTALEVEFRAEGHYGDTLRSACGSGETSDSVELLHSLTREAAGDEVARARTRWGRAV